MPLNLVASLFSFAALAICLYSLFGDVEAEMREQAIYWFLAAFVAALMPMIRQFRYKDLEIAFREEVQQLERRVTEKIDQLDTDMFVALEQVRAGEAALDPAYRAHRDAVFARFATELDGLPAEVRLQRQEALTRQYLSQLKWTVAQLKEALAGLGYYTGTVDEQFTPRLVEAVRVFQQVEGLTPVDGIFGLQSYQKLAQRLGL
jgi:murein L,D-transpeptidase YcbB/YkuD